MAAGDAHGQAQVLTRIELVVQLQHRDDALLQRVGTTLVSPRQQHSELVAADAGCTGGRIHGLGQHFTHAAQHRVTGRMALLVIDHLEAIQVNGDDRQGPGPFAREPVQLFGIEGTVAQLGKYIVFAQVFEVSLGLLARRDIHQGQEHQTPVMPMAIEHRELHVDVHRIARQ